MADSDNNTTRVLRQRQIRHDLSDVLGLVLQSKDDSEGSGFGSDLDIDDFGGLSNTVECTPSVRFVKFMRQ